MLEGLMLTSGYVNDDDGDFALTTDFYELTMAAAYHDALIETRPSSDHINKEKKGISEMFVRRITQIILSGRLFGTSYILSYENEV
jgi:hypothetical protein